MFADPEILTSIRLTLNLLGVLIAAFYIVAILASTARLPQFRFYAWGLLLWLVHIIVFQLFIAIAQPPPGPVTALWSVIVRLHGSITFGTYAVLMYRFADRKYNAKL